MIREATLADVLDLVRLGQTFQATTTYADHVGANPAAMQAIGESLVTSADGLLLALERNGVCVGMLGGQIVLHPLSWERVFVELFWWVDPNARGDGIKLLQQAQAWATDHGALRVIASAPTDKVARVFKWLGYTKVETAYQLTLTTTDEEEAVSETEETLWAI